MLYLLDSSAVLNDFGFEFSSKDSYITTPAVLVELRDLRSRHLADNALAQGLLLLQEPEKQNFDHIETLVRSKGFNKLSKPDKSLLALALGLKKQGLEFILVTDDYSIQNFAKILEIPFEAAMRGEIGKTIAFSISCPSCNKVFPTGSNAQKCPVCGSSLKRKRLLN